MSWNEPAAYTAFEGTDLLVEGSLAEVVLAIKRHLGKAEHSPILIFSNTTGKTIDFNFQGTERDVRKRLELYVGDVPTKAAPVRGRPRLGVICREVSLLPRHWEWLENQPGGASATLRRLVEEARKRSSDSPSIKELQERAYRFLSVLAGDFQGYEEALRALYKRDAKGFQRNIEGWPRDVRAHALELTRAVFG